MRSGWLRLSLVSVLAFGLALAVGCDGDENGGTAPGDGGNGNGDALPTITITVGSGTTPTYSWDGGPVFTVAVVRASEPATIVWGVVSLGDDGVTSPVTHGTVPQGTVEIAAEEPTLSAGVDYRVSAVRMNEEFGFTDFTP